LIASAIDEMVVVLDTFITKELKEEFFVNQFVNYVQKLRKAAGVRKGDQIEIYYEPLGKKLDGFLANFEGTIQAVIKKPFLHFTHKPTWLPEIKKDTGTVDGCRFNFYVAAPTFCSKLDDKVYLELYLISFNVLFFIFRRHKIY
jgi:hypothetical protein